jgi:hypothetical protein
MADKSRPENSGAAMSNKTFLYFAVVVGTAVAGSGNAQVPPSKLISGQVEGAFTNVSGGWCYVAQGSSVYQRNAGISVISLPELIYFDGSYHPLDGQVRLTFTTPTGGTAKFKLWGPDAAALFSGYTETFNGQQYLVNFTITFPNNCALPIFGGYESP